MKTGAVKLLPNWEHFMWSRAGVANITHLRNHGFILTQTGWRLSPLYDVNPVPYGEDLALNVSEDESVISFDLAIETAQYYGLSQNEAEKIVDEISTTVRDNWERLASEYGLSRGNIEKMRPAFSACYA